MTGEAADTDAQPRSTTPRGTQKSQLVHVIGVAVLLLAVLMFWRGFQRPGHDSGDDFALYMNQARALVDGDVGGTIANNKFTVDNSAWHTFSPYVYPWGQPLLMAPVVMVAGAVNPETGINYAPYKLATNITFLIALAGFFGIARRRLGDVVAFALVAFFVVDRLYATATDVVLSEFPFMMWVMLFLWWLDRLVASRRLLSPSRRSLIVLAVFAWMAFETRREGAGLMFGLAAAQLAVLYGDVGPGNVRSRLSRLGAVAREKSQALWIPWAAFVGLVVALQLVLPTDFFPRYAERDPHATSGLWRIPNNVVLYRSTFAELLGFQVDDNTVTLGGSVAWASIAIGAILVLAAAGLVGAIIRTFGRDAGLIGSSLGIAVLVLLAPFQSPRYLMCLVPFVLLFGAMGVGTVLRVVKVRRTDWVTAVATALICLLGLVGLPRTIDAYNYYHDWTGPPSGPQKPETLAMFDQVRELTRGDDVIVFGRARTMTLYTGRRAVQGGDLDFMRRSADYYVMYLNDDGTPGDYSQYPLTDEEARELGFIELWRDKAWVIFKVPERTTES